MTQGVVCVCESVFVRAETNNALHFNEEEWFVCVCVCVERKCSQDFFLTGTNKGYHEAHDTHTSNTDHPVRANQGHLLSCLLLVVLANHHCPLSLDKLQAGVSPRQQNTDAQNSNWSEYITQCVHP